MSKDYKDTLNLPKTAFPMKASLAQREPAMLKRWYDIDLYGQICEQAKGRDKFILHDGPPYANGKLHLGHAVNKTLKDIVVKSKRLSGYASPYIPGWDCHGLPIELNVEKKVGKAGVKIPADEFRKKCREYALKQIDVQRDVFKRLGGLGQWDKPYLTMDFNYEANIVRSLATIIDNGHLERGTRPVHWCLDCSSALAEAEVEYHDKRSHSIDVRFKVLDPVALAQLLEVDAAGTEIIIPIWTTTPWTLPGNQAVAVHPELDYVLLQSGNEIYVFSEVLHEECAERYGIADFKVVTHFKGAVLEGTLLQHPFYEKQVPVILGEHVTIEAGTGNVHIAPSHGPDDFLLGKKYNLALECPVADNGCYTSDTPLLSDLHVRKADEQVLELLREHNVLLSHHEMEHSYPMCWRHKTALIFRVTPQWFISMDNHNLRDKALAAIKETDWIPDWGEARIEGMVSGRGDWCISRQRFWGVPICLFVHNETNEVHPNATDLMRKVAEGIAEHGIEYWFQLEPAEILGDEAEHYRKVSDTLDVWFDSGVSHQCVVQANPDLAYPADLYLEGSDQHRGWFMSSLMTGVAISGSNAYRAALTHGFTVDEKGYKMSKSLGNIVEPEDVIKVLGADVLRLWIAATDYRAEMACSDEILKRTADIYRRVRNTARFLLSNLNGFEPEQHSVPASDMLALDRWVVAKCYEVQQDIKAAYDDYQFHVVCQKLHHFCSIDLGSFYLDVIKDRQYTTQANSLARRSAQTALYYIVESLVRWMAPILSFTADEIWQNIPGQHSESVFLEQWFDQVETVTTDETMGADFWQQVIVVRDAVNKQIEVQRNAGELGSALEAEVELYCDDQLQALLGQLENELRFVLITSAAEVRPLTDKPDSAVSTDLEGLYLQVSPSESTKCVRCWHRRADIGGNAQHPELCARCVENVDGQGEERHYA